MPPGAEFPQQEAGSGRGSGGPGGRGRAYLRSGLSPSLRHTQQQAESRSPLQRRAPLSRPLPPSFCLLLLLQKHSLSGLISSICCDLERIQITTFPCAGHMFALQTAAALSPMGANWERRGGRRGPRRAPTAPGPSRPPAAERRGPAEARVWALCTVAPGFRWPSLHPLRPRRVSLAAPF